MCLAFTNDWHLKFKYFIPFACRICNQNEKQIIKQCYTRYVQFCFNSSSKLVITVLQMDFGFANYVVDWYKTSDIRPYPQHFPLVKGVKREYIRGLLLVIDGFHT